MSQQKQWVKEFVNYLVSLADAGERDRAPLAALKRGASGEPRDLAKVYPLVLPRAPTGRSQQQACLDVACLFGLHPTPSKQRGRAVTLAEAMRRLSAQNGGDKSKSVEARFVALLQCHAEDLVPHLRSGVALARSHDIPLSWEDILWALREWETLAGNGSSAAKSQQRRWAETFWREAPDEEGPASFAR